MPKHVSFPERAATRYAIPGGALAAALAAGVVFLPARAAETPISNNGVPALMQEPGVGWRAYQFGGRAHPASPADVPYDRTANEWQAPESGIGPITADPAHPFYNNAVAQDLGVSSTYRVADLNNAAAKNLLPWAVEALKKQNALTLQNRNGETRQARCWEVGVPDIHEAPFEWYFIQTPKEVVIIQAGAMQTVRRVYLNVPHSKNLKPSWYGESIGHYEGGDTLVVDTIGLNDRTFVDGYRTPHTTQLHVVERFKIANGGKTLDASFTVDDPGTFYRPWGAKRARDRVVAPFEEQVCQLNNDDRFNQGFDPVPTADHIDF
jgi:hypothetical protein